MAYPCVPPTVIVSRLFPSIWPVLEPVVVRRDSQQLALSCPLLEGVLDFMRSATLARYPARVQLYEKVCSALVKHGERGSGLGVRWVGCEIHRSGLLYAEVVTNLEEV